MQEIYLEPVKEELIAQRIQEIKAHGVVAAASLTPQKVERWHEIAMDAGLDILVVQGTVISAEHVSSQGHVLNLKEFVRELPIPVVLGGCASYHTGLHLMRTGAAGVLVGVGPGARAPRAACSASASRRRRRSPTSRRPARRTCSRRASTARSSPTADAQRRRRRQGDRLRRDAVMIGSPLARAYEAAGPRLPLGHGDLPPDPAARRPRRDGRRTGRSRRSSSGPRARTTARST
jgi:IMP dehydrogenase